MTEPNEPVFHADWERRVFALVLAMQFRVDSQRFAIEQMPPARYLATSYYEHWLFGLGLQLEASGLLDSDELKRVREALETVRAPTAPWSVRNGALCPDRARALGPSRGGRRDEPVAPRFAPGQVVLTRNIHPVGHTRLPRYARGRQGVIERDYGVFAFPDSNEAGEGEKPQHVSASGSRRVSSGVPPRQQGTGSILISGTTTSIRRKNGLRQRRIRFRLRADSPMRPLLKPVRVASKGLAIVSVAAVARVDRHRAPRTRPARDADGAAT
jgi:nitrile hydratase